MQNTETFYLYATDGLCNRMRAIDSAITLAKKFDRKLALVWNRNENLNAPFFDLFCPIPNVQIIETTALTAPLIKFSKYPKMNPEREHGIKSKIRRTLWRRIKRIHKIKGEVFYNDLYDVISSNPRDGYSDDNTWNSHLNQLMEVKVRESIMAGYSNYVVSCWRLYPNTEWYKHFVPVDAILSRIETITQPFNHTIGLHIRRTDHQEAIRNSGLERFIERIEIAIKENSKVNFFLATDDLETENLLKEKYQDKIITNPKTSFSRNDVQGIKDAVVDLYCLSKTKIIYGSFGSSFTQVAGDISGIPVMLA